LARLVVLLALPTLSGSVLELLQTGVDQVASDIKTELFV
jgi:hypothetical protein